MPTVKESQHSSAIPSSFSRQKSLILVAASFLAWGFLRALNDVVVATDQVQRPSHDATAMLIHVSFFASYLLFPALASSWISRFGLSMGLAASTGLMGCSAVLCSITLHSESGLPYFASLFGLAAGVAFLQTCGNPAVALLGPQETVARRLLTVQSAMSLGAALAPFCVGIGHPVYMLDPIAMLAGSRIIYSVAGTLLIVLAYGFIAGSKRDTVLQKPVADNGTIRRQTRVSTKYATVAVFLFVGTEATVLTHILEFRRLTSLHGEAFLWTVTLSGYWAFVTFGRAFSSYLLKRTDLIRLLRWSALLGAALVCLALLLHSKAATIILLITGLVNAAIFPAVFSLSTDSLDKHELNVVSARLMTAISGGAVMPLLSGILADHTGLKGAFFLPILSYIWIAANASRYSSNAPLVHEMHSNTY